jgi:hypothetical protein
MFIDSYSYIFLRYSLRAHAHLLGQCALPFHFRPPEEYVCACSLGAIIFLPPSRLANFVRRWGLRLLASEMESWGPHGGDAQDAE